MAEDIRRFGPDPALRAWADAALPLARAALSAPDRPLRCGGTWDVGLDLLANAPDGRVAGVPLPWALLGLPPQPLHRAQLSTTYPGFPRPGDDETPAATNYRRKRDGAHLDGLKPFGPDRRRRIDEPHAFILGIALTEADPAASPLVAWPGSAPILRAALLEVLTPYPPECWHEIDVTEAYQAARADVFCRCPRVTLQMRPGEAILLHRLTLHGVAPWAEGARADPEGRVIAYFRPYLPSVKDWLAS